MSNLDGETQSAAVTEGSVQIHFPAAGPLPDLHVTVIEAALQSPDEFRVAQDYRQPGSTRIDPVHTETSKTATNDSFFDQVS